MNIKYISFLISGLFSCFLFFSCNDDNNTTSYTSQTKDAQIYSFSMTGTHDIDQDSIPRAHDSIRFIQINKTKFAIDQVAGVIYNPDSMPYGTVLKNKVAVATSYNPIYGISSVSITTPDSIKGYIWNRTDSVDFSKSPITFVVTSVGNTTKSYKIDLRIHKIDPDTIEWKQMSSYPESLGQSKTIQRDNRFYTYSVNNGVVALYTSASSQLSWKKESLAGLPATINPESIFFMNSVFYCISSNGSSYKSTDGINWGQVANGKTVASVLGVIPEAERADDQLLVVFSEGSKFYFGKTKDMATIDVVQHISSSPVNNEVPANFPISGGASYTNISTDKKTRMLILTGGLDYTGKELPYTWLIKNSSEGLDMTPFMKNSLFKGGGLSNFVYDGLLYALTENELYTSTIWGESWIKAPSKQMPTSNITKRSEQSVIVDNENNIWIFGGVSDGGVYLNDVWKGRLNRLNP